MLVGEKELAVRLTGYDWSFPQSSIEAQHSIHPYPAKFIPEIPRTLIKEIGIPKGCILVDPFCGSGTTLVEARAAGLDAIGVDSNPIACLISKVKTTPLPRGFKESSEKVVIHAKAVLPQKPRTNIPNVDHWFKKEVQVGLDALSIAITAVAPGPLKDALLLALSSIIVRVSNQDSDTRYAAVEKKVTLADVFRNFQLASDRISLALAGNQHAGSVRVVCSDSTKMQYVGAKRIGLVITSPPYPNAYEYWLYHKYRMYWLGFDPRAVKATEIGARAHFFKKNHHTGDDFRRQMSAVLKPLIVSSHKSAHFCFVIGRSVIHGEVIDNSQIIIDEARALGLTQVATLSRQILRNRKSFNLSHANIKQESVLIFGGAR